MIYLKVALKYTTELKLLKLLDLSLCMSTIKHERGTYCCKASQASTAIKESSCEVINAVLPNLLANHLIIKQTQTKRATSLPTDM